MLYVVPRFSRIYEDRATDLPLVSKALLAWGRTVEGHGLALTLLLAVAAAGAAWALRSAPVRAWFAARMWRIPGIAERLRMYQLARFYRTVGMLLRSGLPLLVALEMGAGLLSAGLREFLAKACRAIGEGQSVSASMDRHGLATPVALRMLTVGEQSGNMSEMMERIAVFHDEEITRWVDWATRLFEPLLMVAIGLVIGAIVVLMYFPIFELAGSLR
jgi:general secretion pathway protein F